MFSLLLHKHPGTFLLPCPDVFLFFDWRVKFINFEELLLFLYLLEKFPFLLDLYLDFSAPLPVLVMSTLGRIRKLAHPLKRSTSVAKCVVGSSATQFVHTYSPAKWTVLADARYWMITVMRQLLFFFSPPNFLPPFFLQKCIIQLKVWVDTLANDLKFGNEEILFIIAPISFRIRLFILTVFLFFSFYFFPILVMSMHGNGSSVWSRLSFILSLGHNVHCE